MGPMGMTDRVESPLVKEPGGRYLVYTSAGDASCLHKWLRGNRNFDLWITYYGDHHGRYKQLANYYNVRKGGKFPNLQYVCQKWPHLFEQYEAVLALDDDIVIRASAINRLFDIRAEYDLWLLQPAYDPRGKISHAVTRMQRTTLLRYTNFVENGCVLFRKDKLDAFLRVFEPVLVGWGTDWWYLDVLGEDLEGKVAITDVVTCVNPHDHAKGGQREIDKLQPRDQRIAAWEMVKLRFDIRSEERGIIEYGNVPRSAAGKVAGTIRGATRSLPVRWRNKWRAWLGRARTRGVCPGRFQARTESKS